MASSLSVIVIARNEEVKIGACLDSCVRSIQAAKSQGLIDRGEIVLVDSASTDRTVEIAKAYPATIVHLPAEWHLSAAAGRFVGTRHVTGDLLLFVDGDFVLIPEWLPEAIRALLRDEKIAAVCGREIEELTGDSLLTRRLKSRIESLVAEPTAVNVGLYRRGALMSTGGIHPFLRGAEDRDVAYRLREAGYHLIRIDREMGTHRWSDRGALDFITYFRSVIVWSIGDGQLYRIRKEVRTAIADIRRRYANARYVHNYLLGLGGTLLLLTNLAAVFSFGPWIAVAADLSILLALLAVKSARRQTWKELLFSFHVFPYSIVRHGGFLAGFLRPPPDPSRYPTGERAVEPGNPVSEL